MAFRQHWAGPHAEIARHLPGLVRYDQNHVLGASVSELDAEWPIHGFVELWFRNAAAIAEAARSEATRRLIADEPAFLSALTGLIMAEAPPYDAPAHRIFAVDRTGAPAGPRAQQWSHLFAGKSFIKVLQVAQVMRRQDLASEPHPPAFVAIAGFADLAQASAAFAQAAAAAKAAGLELYLTEQVRIV
ncbi:EthD protein [bacterium YEK0313]|nr:EthD protein [bacterium YEK0313]